MTTIEADITEYLMWMKIHNYARTTIASREVYELIRTGQLESVQIGASRRIPVEALEDYVRQLRVSSKMYAHRGNSADRSVSRE